ncbi:MAG: transcriptional regulator NrdR [Candidatus Marinimicrobia bacterium]|nr:transcriptional regulator NrdR [Candidatus Neomarinimicrobiota bacterium]MCF7827692.1 transcriptional regulator NrdR [Candidatus Neomarinimicrobiota bacterium]MCF7881253.1 transcriptional regulator NrdR [Candidatus Neomarinimicrobiota bacterium]
MWCPFCQHTETSVIETRYVQRDNSVRRRRVCDECQERFTTYEYYAPKQLTVIKSNGGREDFFRVKLYNSLKIALNKRGFSSGEIEQLVTDIENEIRRNYPREVHSKEIGEVVMKHLKTVDKVAYIRFASVYRDFQDVGAFEAEIQGMD